MHVCIYTYISLYMLEEDPIINMQVQNHFAEITSKGDDLT